MLLRGIIMLVIANSDFCLFQHEIARWVCFVRPGEDITSSDDHPIVGAGVDADYEIHNSKSNIFFSRVVARSRDCTQGSGCNSLNTTAILLIGLLIVDFIVIIKASQNRCVFEVCRLEVGVGLSDYSMYKLENGRGRKAWCCEAKGQCFKLTVNKILAGLVNDPKATVMKYECSQGGHCWVPVEGLDLREAASYLLLDKLNRTEGPLEKCGLQGVLLNSDKTLLEMGTGRSFSRLPMSVGSARNDLVCTDVDNCGSWDSDEDEEIIRWVFHEEGESPPAVSTYNRGGSSIEVDGVEGTSPSGHNSRLTLEFGGFSSQDIWSFGREYTSLETASRLIVDVNSSVGVLLGSAVALGYHGGPHHGRYPQEGPDTRTARQGYLVAPDRSLTKVEPAVNIFSGSRTTVAGTSAGSALAAVFFLLGCGERGTVYTQVQ